MTTAATSRHLRARAATRVAMAIPLVGAMFFVSAGTLNYWEAWLYLAVLFIPLIGIALYLLQSAPDLVERRLELREQAGAQKAVIAGSAVILLAAFVLPGLDRRYGWSAVPPLVVLAADAFILAGFVILAQVYRANRYAARTVRVEQGQAVISTGPYVVVRHPMYLAMLVIFVLSPLALGSYWAVLPALVMFPVLMARIRTEEATLLKDLPGYREYVSKTRFRLIPGVW